MRQSQYHSDTWLPKEADITNQIRDGLRLAGADLWYRKILGTLGQRDIPDLIGCWKGRFFAIEVKRPGNGPTPGQQATLNAISRAGGIACVATSLEDVIEAFETQGSPLPFQRRLIPGSKISQISKNSGRNFARD